MTCTLKLSANKQRLGYLTDWSDVIMSLSVECFFQNSGQNYNFISAASLTLVVIAASLTVVNDESHTLYI